MFKFCNSLLLWSTDGSFAGVSLLQVHFSQYLILSSLNSITYYGGCVSPLKCCFNTAIPLVTIHSFTL